jgi:hypothetical protein
LIDGGDPVTYVFHAIHNKALGKKGEKEGKVIDFRLTTTH